MTSYRRAAFTLATCVVGLTAACSAGITSASPPKAPTTPASHHTAPPPTRTAAPSSSPPASAGTASVAGLGSFPIPSGAQVAANLACGKGDIIEAGPVTPAAAAAFYTSALPKAGYVITENTLGSVPGIGPSPGVASTVMGSSGLHTVRTAHDLPWCSGCHAEFGSKFQNSLVLPVYAVTYA